MGEGSASLAEHVLWVPIIHPCWLGSMLVLVERAEWNPAADCGAGPLGGHSGKHRPRPVCGPGLGEGLASSCRAVQAKEPSAG